MESCVDLSPEPIGLQTLQLFLRLLHASTRTPRSPMQLFPAPWQNPSGTSFHSPPSLQLARTDCHYPCKQHSKSRHPLQRQLPLHYPDYHHILQLVPPQQPLGRVMLGLSEERRPEVDQYVQTQQISVLLGDQH